MPHGNLGIWYVYNISFSSIICLGFCFFPCVCVCVCGGGGGGGIYCYVVTKNWNPMFTSWETCTQFLVCNCRLLSDFTDNTCLRIVRQDMQYRVTKKIVVGMEFLRYGVSCWNHSYELMVYTGDYIPYFSVGAITHPCRNSSGSPVNGVDFCAWMIYYIPHFTWRNCSPIRVTVVPSALSSAMCSNYLVKVTYFFYHSVLSVLCTV